MLALPQGPLPHTNRVRSWEPESSLGRPEGYNADQVSQPVAIKPQVLKPVVIEVVSIRISKLLLKLRDWHYKVMIR